jgi:1-acyl-sn-glycerol-3-phosphate acyltransferase
VEPSAPRDELPAERPSWFYRTIGTLVRLILRLYFSDIHIERIDRLPHDGPLVLAANHPSSVADALILGIVTRRVVHYIAHAGLFRNPLQRRLLNACGVIPVHRRGDEAGSEVDRNREAFAAAESVLARGGVIGIFPEGTSHQERIVTRLRTGAARMALQAEASHDFALGVLVVPIGMNFESLTRFRTRVQLNVGRPLATGDYADEYRRDPATAVRRLTDDLQTRLQRLIVNIAEVDLTDLIQDLVAVYLDELKAHVHTLDDVGMSRAGPRIGAEGAPPSRGEDFVLTRAIADAVHALRVSDPVRLTRLARHVRRYRRSLRRLQVSDRFVRGERHGGTLAGVLPDLARALVVAVAGLPVAVVGTLGNVVPYLCAGVCGRYLAPDVTKVTTLQLLVGSFAFAAWYALTIVVLRGLIGTLPVVFLAGCLPGTGLFTLWYFRWIRYHARRVRFLFLAWIEAEEVDKLRSVRRAVIAEIDAVRDELLAG